MAKQLFYQFKTPTVVRHNELEEKVNQLFWSLFDIEEIRRGTSSEALKIAKEYNDSTKLFYDACSRTLTPCGYQKRTEFVFHAPKYFNIGLRVECKSQRTHSNIISNIFDELNIVNDIDEELYCLVLEGAYLTNYNISRLKNEIKRKDLKERVWYGNVSDFKNLLIKLKRKKLEVL